MENLNTATELDFPTSLRLRWASGRIGWKYYNSIRKKAMEQEFSWSGLAVSLSIAFFVVVSSSLALSFFYKSLENLNMAGSF